ncbi:MAG: hypothetical protein JW966_14505 [Anaerolineae bacterium]|nr:hypothetical protein [Anaerolineae bacterium]
MSEIIIFDNEFITIRYLEDKKIIYHTIHKPLPDQVLKEALDAGTEALKKYGACKWLSDDRNLGPLSPEFMEYSRTDWQPRTIAVGWKYWANVVPEELVAAGSLTPVMENLYELGLRMMVFTDLEEAFRWLERMAD